MIVYFCHIHITYHVISISNHEFCFICYSPDNTKFRSKVEIAAYLKQKNLPHSIDDFSFSRAADSSVSQTPKAASTEKTSEQGEESPTKKTRGRPAGKLLVKMPFSDKKAEKAAAEVKSEEQVDSETKKSPAGRRRKSTLNAEEVSAEPESTVASEQPEPVSDTPGEEKTASKRGRPSQQKKSEAVVNTDENTQEYCEQATGEPAAIGSALQDEEKLVTSFLGQIANELIPDANLTAESAGHGEGFNLFSSEMVNEATGAALLADKSPFEMQGKRVRTPKLFADEMPTSEGRRLSQEDAASKAATWSSSKKESEVEGSRKKKGGRPRKVEQRDMQFDPFVSRQMGPTHFDSPQTFASPPVKQKKFEAKKRKADLESDLELLAQHASDGYDLVMDIPPVKKERKSGAGRSSWGEVRRSEGAVVDTGIEEKEAKRERERGKFFEPVIMMGRRERKKTSWMNDDWVDPETVTSLQWNSGGGGTSSSRGFDRDELFMPSRSSSGGGRGGRSKKMEFAYDKAKEDSLLADLYDGAYGEPSGYSQPRHHKVGGRKSYDDGDMGGSALRMHLSQPVAPAVNIDEMFIAEQSSKHRDGLVSSSVGAYRKVGNSFLSKALNERKERSIQDDTPPCICPHPSDDHAYSSLVVRQQQQSGDHMLDDDDDGMEEYGASADIGGLLHGPGDEDIKMMVAPVTAGSFPNGRRHQQSQFIVPVHNQLHGDKVAIQYLPMSAPIAGNNGSFPAAVLENGVDQNADGYRTDDVAASSLSESLPLVLMEDDVLDRSDATYSTDDVLAASALLKSASQASVGRLASATR
jgi:hypothetical protein